MYNYAQFTYELPTLILILFVVWYADEYSTSQLKIFHILQSHMLILSFTWLTNIIDLFHYITDILALVRCILVL